ncbi:cytochrome P450 family protein [Streptomyces gibsoniae]|uniref:Cytochrome P450 n=1 Tax=Streptomyces gibsoniae TaxID=3075529 RepID=A0ABU2U075_9ACTN|nr:cytochrome P450 [Streptomyces sp. DSM 41699]MDT0466627.1 cytochrome P450 [Streptomyces sp. DSM 41699]
MATASPDLSALVADPYSTYARLREAGPVHRVTGPDGLPVWIVTRYADVRQLLADPRLSLDKAHRLPGNYPGFTLPPALDLNLLNMDPPDHTRIRHLVTKAFTPGRVEEMRPGIQALADQLLDGVAGRGRADLVAEFAAPLPITVICDLLGVPHDSRLDFRAWTDALVAPDPSNPGAAKKAVAAMLTYFPQLIADKRRVPGDDLLTDLIDVRDDGDKLTEDELTSLAFLILVAGYENTVQLIGTAVLALLDHPVQLAALRDNPAKIDDAVEEFARYDGPALLAIRRFPTEDVEVCGVTIPAGETVMLSLASANRDPDRFPGPDRLDLARREGGHLALGHGIHYCVGAPLARLETQIAVSSLLRRFPALELDVPRDQLRWRPSMRARGLIALPVRF